MRGGRTVPAYIHPPLPYYCSTSDYPLCFQPCSVPCDHVHRTAPCVNSVLDSAATSYRSAGLRHTPAKRAISRRLHRNNHPSKRSRAYTKGKGPWRVAVAVFGLRSNRQSVWLERALKHHARHRARPAGLSAVQSAVLSAVRVSSRPELWWRGGAGQTAPTLHVHVFKCAWAFWPEELPFSATSTAAASIFCQRQRAFSPTPQ